MRCIQFSAVSLKALRQYSRRREQWPSEHFLGPSLTEVGQADPGHVHSRESCEVNQSPSPPLAKTLRYVYVINNVKFIRVLTTQNKLIVTKREILCNPDNQLKLSSQPVMNEREYLVGNS